MPNETPQPAGIVASFDRSAFEITEGVAVDASGNVFVSFPALGEIRRFAPGSDVLTNGIVRVDPDGTITPIAGGPEAGFDGPTSMAFGVGATELTMYAVNLANGSFVPNEFVGPALVAFDVDTPGMPLP